MALDEGNKVFRVERLACTDGIPAICCEDYPAKKQSI